MSLLQEQAERMGWVFQANQNLHMAEKTLDSGVLARQESLTLEGLLTAIECFESLQARIDKREPVTYGPGVEGVVYDSDGLRGRKKVTS